MRPNFFDFDRYRSRGPYDHCSPCAQFAELLRDVSALLREWRRRGRDRRELAGLDYRMRRDIGVTPGDIARECAKPFWRE